MVAAGDDVATSLRESAEAPNVWPRAARRQEAWVVQCRRPKESEQWIPNCLSCLKLPGERGKGNLGGRMKMETSLHWMGWGGAGEAGRGHCQDFGTTEGVCRGGGGSQGSGRVLG